MEDKLNQIKQDSIVTINQASTLKELDQIFLELFGKNGALTLIPRDFPKLPKEELKTVAPLFNQIKSVLEQAIAQKRTEVKEQSYQKLTDEKLDLNVNESLTKQSDRKGNLHPITKFEKEIVDIFSNLGFQQYDAPQIDTDYYNFAALNIPAEHPARDLWDTLYIDQAEKFGFKPGELLLRTHTSNSQVRILKEFKPPIRMMIMGRCFRYENLDPRHEHTFEQFEIVYVDKKVNMANLQYLSEQFLQAIFGSEIKARLRPKYYPFVEPGAGVDGLCMFCKGKGCKICGEVGWLELAGAGMIHPTVLKNGGIDPEVYSGIAWGFGPYRMGMIKYGVNDVRVFNSGDLRLLNEAREQK